LRPRPGEELSVPQLRDFLSRFRPAGAPGAARAAVPADRRRQLEAEVDPVLKLLDGPDAECTRIIAAARRDAEQAIAAANATRRPWPLMRGSALLLPAARACKTRWPPRWPKQLTSRPARPATRSRCVSLPVTAFLR
jgi:hypothetical protein